MLTSGKPSRPERGRPTTSSAAPDLGRLLLLGSWLEVEPKPHVLFTTQSPAVIRKLRVLLDRLEGTPQAAAGKVHP